MAPVGIRYRSNTYQNIGRKFNKGCIIFLICKNNRLKLQYPCICRYQSYHHHTWIQRLAWEVGIAVNGKKTVLFNSINYLPELKFHRTYSYKPQPFRFDQTKLISTTLSSILRLWLHFPSDQHSLLQLLLINIVLSKSPSSVLFLGKIWEMYTTPFSTVFNV